MKIALFDDNNHHTEDAIKLENMVNSVSVKELVDFCKQSGYDMRHAEYIITQAVMDMFLNERFIGHVA